MYLNVAYNMDCMEAMREYPDKYFDLAVVDPPYGGSSQSVQVERDLTSIISHPAKDGRFGNKGSRFEKYRQIGGIFSGPEITAVRRGHGHNKYGDGEFCCSHWDVAPPPEYFSELARISKNQIIWGGNYFDLPPTRCFLIWRKLTISENFTMAMAEYAWTSFNDNAKVFEFAPQGNRENRFHPTQKPVELYKWVLSRYAKKGDRILDTHLGSGSSRIAAYDLGFDFVGYEINKTYFDLQEERFAKHTAQTSLFVDSINGEDK